MVRIGLVVVAIGLGILMLFGIGAGVGLVRIGPHGINFGRGEDNSIASDTSPGAVSADDLLRQKKVSYQPLQRTLATESPKPQPSAATKPSDAPARLADSDLPKNKPAEIKRPTVRIAAGSDKPLKDPDGNVWETSSGFDGGSIHYHADAPIANTNFPELYRGELWGVRSWHRDVPNGHYKVKLHFAETYDGSNPDFRVFEVRIADQSSGEINIYRETGGLNRAMQRTMNAEITDGTITIQFVSRVQNPAIYGIELIPDGRTAALPPRQADAISQR